MSKFNLRALLLLLLTFTAGYSLWQAYQSAGPIMSASVSSNGRFAITAHKDQKLILWDMEEHSRRIISRNANIYSAYFIKRQPIFLWQDLDNAVTAQSVNGEIKKSFELDKSTYGHLMTHDLSTYYYSDIGWGLFQRTEDGSTDTLKATDRKAFFGYYKLFNLSIDESEQWIVSAGSGEPKGFDPPYYRSLQEVLDQGADYQHLYSVALWNLETGQPSAKLDGNSSKTHATISPDGQWVVSADEAGIGLFWNTDQPANRSRVARYHSGIYLEDTPFETGDPRNWDKSKLIEDSGGLNTFTIAVAFIHNSEYYLRFGNDSHMTALFKTGSPWPVKYFDLGESPKLVTYGSQYDRNTAIATSPEAGILAMGHQSTGGISVYQFDPDELTLERIWVVE
ncbi:MAG TPA: WD40 repeat domain-containing protein [Marinobacter sp.]|uniref:WD40 repeat domain-containing protein n=1 Tax=Marinobacter antarcticus TaxID=564117 RepID=A0A831R6U3_9GAMM|nr:WD40 repeat domain-containing protein [Marinobacter antarcticus]HDZ39705.1 WD40 repeat domain-containing protein [Marinobacter sp.]HEA53259.1 WD40 repeat domain-containing protein [Marinobacter antarcticus]